MKAYPNVRIKNVVVDVGDVLPPGLRAVIDLVDLSVGGAEREVLEQGGVQEDHNGKGSGDSEI